jgi:hypothetical protein
VSDCNDERPDTAGGPCLPRADPLADSAARQPDVARFALDPEKELLGLQRERRDAAYQPGA